MDLFYGCYPVILVIYIGVCLGNESYSRENSSRENSSEEGNSPDELRCSAKLLQSRECTADRLMQFIAIRIGAPSYSVMFDLLPSPVPKIKYARTCFGWDIPLFPGEAIIASVGYRKSQDIDLRFCWHYGSEIGTKVPCDIIQGISEGIYTKRLPPSNVPNDKGCSSACSLTRCKAN